MPRLKPPPSKPEPDTGIASEPPVGDIEIDLGGEVTGEVEIDLTKAAAPEAVVVEKKVEPAAQDDDPLARALAAQKRAEDLQRTAQRERDEALRGSRERDEELVRERSEREGAEYNSVLTAIAAEQSTLAGAKQAYAAAAYNSDWAAAAEAQEVIAGAKGRLDRLEDGKQSFETRRETQKAAPVQQQRQVPATVDEQITAMKVPDKAKEWLRTHPEMMSRTDELGAVHNYLEKIEHVAPFSDAYFDALDTRFGFKEPPQRVEPSHQQQTQRRSMPVSAPVSREVPNASGTRQKAGTMTLSEEERRIARNSFSDPNVTDAQKEFLYAKNKQKLQAMKANGSYTEAKG